MNAETFCEQFATFAESPEGIETLREMILQLAVQGKLVPQDDRDEAASVLIELANKASSGLKAGKGTKETESVLPEVEGPISCPSGWVWTQLGRLGKVSPRNELPDDFDVSFLPMASISATYNAPLVPEVRKWRDLKKGFTHVADGDVAMAKITPCFQNGKTAVMRGLTNGYGAGTTELHVLRPFPNCLIPDYAVIFLRSPQFVQQGVARMSGSAGQQRVPKEYFAESAFPLPPLAEQQRIVAKVDQLLGLCDELAARRTAQRAARSKVVAATLDRLVSPSTPAEFPTHAGRLRNHFDQLFDTPTAIPQLRQSILQLAIQGQLVPQNSNDEPAVAIFERLMTERKRLAKEQKIRQPKTRAEDSEPQFDLASGWVWAQAEDVCKPASVITYGILKPEWVPVGVPTVRVQDMKNGQIVVDRIGQCSPARADKFSKTTLAEGDLLIAKDGATLGKTAFVPPSLAGGNVTQHVLRFPISRHVWSWYIRLVVDSPHGQAWMRKETRGVALPGVNVEDFRRMPLPLPPLAEQKRIVAKVTELLSLCDALEAKLTQAESASSELLAAAVHQLLSATTPGVPAHV